MNETISDLIDIKISRRKFIGGAAALAALMALPVKLNALTSKTKTLDAAEGYKPNYLIGWGDKILQGEDIAENQFGYNCDFNAFMPINGSNTHGLLCTNHETTDYPLMFAKDSLTEDEIIKQEMLAHGHSVVEIFKDADTWKYNANSPLNRRINAFDTEFDITGPARDKIGRSVIGTVNNCGGGKTPWNTLLVCEENFNGYFYGKDSQYGINENERFYKWRRFDKRFADMNEAKKFGWVWEYDPYNVNSKPKKLTALGRMKHESAVCAKAGEQVVVYMGDDQRFQYLYKYVGEDLENGTLYVAKFDENKVNWLAIDPADVVDTRNAAKKLKATKMDRPEDITIDPRRGDVYVAMSKNPGRKTTNPANPRIKNIHGHIIKLTPETHDELEHGWDIYLLGNENMSCPDNLHFKQDKLWIATDGMEGTVKQNDGLFLIDNFREPAPKKILSMPSKAEATGPETTPNGKSMFLSVQHPGQYGKFENPSTRWPDFDETKPPRPSVIAFDI